MAVLAMVVAGAPTAATCGCSRRNPRRADRFHLERPQRAVQVLEVRPAAVAPITIDRCLSIVAMSTAPRVFQTRRSASTKHGRYISMRVPRCGLRSGKPLTLVRASPPDATDIHGLKPFDDGGFNPFEFASGFCMDGHGL